MNKLIKSVAAGLATITMATAATNVFAIQHTHAATKNKTVTIYLTRHGQTNFNVAGLCQGWVDSPLTNEGVKVAKQLGTGLYGIKFKHAYSGDLMRQYKTAHYALNISDNATVKQTWTSNLREGGYGSFEGLPYSMIQPWVFPNITGHKYTGDDWGKAQKEMGMNFWPALQDAYYKTDRMAQYTNKALPASAKSETAKQVTTRMNKQLVAIGKKYQKSGGNVLVVSSGMSIPEWLTTQKNFKSKAALNLGNEAVIKITYKNGKFYFPKNITSDSMMNTVNKGAKLQTLPKNTLKSVKVKKGIVTGKTSKKATIKITTNSGKTVKVAKANAKGIFKIKLNKKQLKQVKKNVKIQSIPAGYAHTIDYDTKTITQTVFGNKMVKATVK